MSKNILDIIVMINIFWCFTGLWFFPGSIKVSMGIAITSILIKFFFEKNKIIETIKKNAVIIILLLVTFIFGEIIDVFFSSFSRSILTASILIASIKKFDSKIIFITAIVHASYLVYMVLYLGLDRPQEILNPNIYGPIFGLLFLLSFNEFLMSRKVVILVISIILLWAVFIMQSRGVILGCLVALTLSLFREATYILRKNILISLGVIFSITIILTNTNKIENLYNNTMSEIHNLNNGYMSSSIGLRLEMSLVSFEMIKEKPIFGHHDDFYNVRNKIINDYNFNHQIISFKTLHNVYLDSWARMGIFGLIIFIFFTLYPYISLRKTDNRVLGIALSLFTFIISMVDTALLGGPYLLVLLLSCHLIKGNEEAKEVPVA